MFFSKFLYQQIYTKQREYESKQFRKLTAIATQPPIINDKKIKKEQPKIDIEMSKFHLKYKKTYSLNKIIFENIFQC
jgi:hypothetical protein